MATTLELFSYDIMHKPERSNFTSLDFAQWKESGNLELTPKFQRRQVWPEAAKSFLIDTILRGFPVPPIYIRNIQVPEKKIVVRQVIDGQQRISTVLDFMNDRFRLARNIDSEYRGRFFSELPNHAQQQIETYSFICEMLHGASDAEVLEIFSRLNTYSIRLNKQELRNGKYFGPFKRTCYSLAHEQIEFWRRNNIFTDRGISRMLEVELTSELVVMQLDGLQDKKDSIDKFYKNYDNEFPERNIVEKRFRGVIDQITETFDTELKDTEFRRPPIFYSLFGAIYHHSYGVKGEEMQTPRRTMAKKEQADLRAAVQELSFIITNTPDDGRNQEDQRFYEACQRGTDNIRPRRTRLDIIYHRAFG